MCDQKKIRLRCKKGMPRERTAREFRNVLIFISEWVVDPKLRTPKVINAMMECVLSMAKELNMSVKTADIADIVALGLLAMSNPNGYMDDDDFMHFEKKYNISGLKRQKDVLLKILGKVCPKIRSIYGSEIFGHYKDENLADQKLEELRRFHREAIDEKGEPMEELDQWVKENWDGEGEYTRTQPRRDITFEDEWRRTPRWPREDAFSVRYDPICKRLYETYGGTSPYTYVSKYGLPLDDLDAIQQIEEDQKLYETNKCKRWKPNIRSLHSGEIGRVEAEFKYNTLTHDEIEYYVADILREEHGGPNYKPNPHNMEPDRCQQSTNSNDNMLLYLYLCHQVIAGAVSKHKIAMLPSTAIVYKEDRYLVDKYYPHQWYNQKHHARVDEITPQGPRIISKWIKNHNYFDNPRNMAFIWAQDYARGNTERIIERLERGFKGCPNRELYCMPIRFPAIPIGHATMLIIDVNNKDIEYYDSATHWSHESAQAVKAFLITLTEVLEHSWSRVAGDKYYDGETATWKATKLVREGCDEEPGDEKAEYTTIPSDCAVRGIHAEPPLVGHRRRRDSAGDDPRGDRKRRRLLPDKDKKQD